MKTDLGRKKIEGDEPDNNGRFTPFGFGNEYWKRRTFNGAPRAFETPEDLTKAVFEYVQFCQDNPIYEHKAFGTGLILKVPKMRAPTATGFCVWFGVSRSVWEKYKLKDDFKDCIQELSDVLFQINFEGAAAGMLNPAIIARQLGLADKVEADQTVTVEVVDRFEEPDDD